MNPDETMRRLETLLSHVWMVRAFLKHSDEAQEDEELQDVHRALYDYQLAVGAAWREKNAAEYLHLARKKFSKLRGASEQFARIQPEISSHTNFQMAVASLNAAVGEIGRILNQLDSPTR
ncbi:MAG: amidohydrolase [Planctomycetia bacterium]|nr:amidohydrolase [Planctomycetia bacterium]